MSGSHKIGDLVKVSMRWITTGTEEPFIGTVVDIKETEDLFSEKYAIMETNTYIHVLSNGNVTVHDLDECIVEVINDCSYDK